jgi:hypothetical protein
LRLHVSFQIVFFLFTYHAIQNYEKDAESHGEESRQHQFIPPRILGEDAPGLCICIVGDESGTKQKHAKHDKYNAYVEHSNACYHLQKQIPKFEQPVDRLRQVGACAHDTTTAETQLLLLLPMRENSELGLEVLRNLASLEEKCGSLKSISGT